MTTTMEQQRRGRVLVSDRRASAWRGKLHKKLSDLRSLGMAGFVRKAIRDHIYFTRDYVLLEHFLDPDASGPASTSDLMVIEPGDPIPDFQRHFPAQAANYEADIRGGCLAFVALKEGAVVAVAFGSLQDYHEKADRYWFRVGEGDAYLFNWLVPPDQRGFALVSRLVKFSNAWLVSRGCRRTYCVVEPWNLPSLGTLLFLGYQEVGRVIHIRRLLRWSWSNEETYTEPRFARFARKRRTKR